MKLHQDTEEATKTCRKRLKPQVERRRRERMNRSLESLKTLLLHTQEETRRRVEKAEILEHTVLFLQDTARRDCRLSPGARSPGARSPGARSPGARSPGARSPGAQSPSFQDGFSSCLQRATRFLGPQGRGQWLGAALDRRLTPTQPDAAAHQPPLSSSLLLQETSRCLLRMLLSRQRVGRAQAPGDSHPASPPPPQVHHTGASRAAGKQSPSHSATLRQGLWRPWP